MVVMLSEPPVTPEISSAVPEMVLIAAMLLDEAVMLEAPVRFSNVPVASVGAVPPKLLKVKADVIELVTPVPANVRVEPPLIVMAWLVMIPPAT